MPLQTAPAAQTQPGILQAIEDAAKAAYDNVKTRFSAGPPAGTLSAAPGSPLAQHDTTIQQLSRLCGNFPSPRDCTPYESSFMTLSFFGFFMI